MAKANRHSQAFDLDMYRERMQEIARRLEVVASLVHERSNLLYLPPQLESVYLQLRHILELIATASLSVNQEANDELRKEGKRKWHAGDILGAVKAVNPDFYYPKPIRLVRSSAQERTSERHVGEWVDVKGDYLTEERFRTLYDASSRLLHTPNPFDRRAVRRDKKTDTNLMRQGAKWHQRIIDLIQHHKFRPASEPDTKLYICHTVSGVEEGRPVFGISEFQIMSQTPSPALTPTMTEGGQD